MLLVFHGLKSGVAALVLVCLLYATGHSQIIKGRVVSIADGDTLTVLGAKAHSANFGYNFSNLVT